MSIYRGPGGAGDATDDATITQVQAYATDAANSATAAANSATTAAGIATNASTSATNAANSASSASTSATNAASSASAASTSATNASNSATAAAGSATSAATSASSASTSATASSSSASAASTSATNAATSATNAANSASAAATSATNAANASRLTAGTATTGAAGSSVALSITGSAGSQVLNVTIPKGDTGATGATGPTGPQGPQGVKGDTGSGLPTGGLSGQILGKASSADYDYVWQTISGAGTVTSVSMTVPTGLSVSGSPITSSGTFAVSLQTGYSIPTTASQSNWTTAYGWGNHASAGYLTSSTAASTYVALSGSYADPTWITSLAYSKLTGAPTTVSSFTNDSAYVTAAGARSALSFVAGSGAYNATTGVITIPTNTNQLTNGAGFLTTAVTSAAAGTGISVSGSTGAVTITNSAPMTYAGAGIAVSTGSAWGTSLTAPSGTIVGTTDTQTLTNKRITSRVTTTTTASSPSINTDTTDMFGLTAQAAGIASFTTNLTGTPVNGQKLWIYIVPTTSSTITWGTSFESSTATLPTAFTTGVRIDVGFVYNSATSKWRCIAVA